MQKTFWTVPGMALAVALAAPAPAAAPHVHKCDCGHPQGLAACGSTTGGALGQIKPVGTVKRAGNLSNRPMILPPKAEFYAEDQGDDPMPQLEMPQINVRLGVFAVLIPCILALGLMGVAMMTRRA